MTNIIKRLGLGIAFCIFFISRVVFAESSRFSIVYFRPATGSGDLVTTLGSVNLPQKDWQGYTYFSYAHNPLQLTQNDAEQFGVVDQLFIQHVGGSFGVTNWWQTELDLPIIWYNSFTEPVIPAPPADTKMGLGDLRWQNRLSLFNREQHPLGLSFVSFVTFPLGNESYFISDTGPTIGAFLIVDKKISKIFFVSLNVGYWGREQITFPGTNVDNLMILQGGIGATYKNWMFKIDALSLTPADHPYEESSTTPVEVTIGIDSLWGQKQKWKISAGGGVALTNGLGAPLFRSFLGLSFIKF